MWVLLYILLQYGQLSLRQFGVLSLLYVPVAGKHLPEYISFAAIRIIA